ncbi:hypothetical protein LTR53_014276 [Teratosphaeriaceae sp. CCFEE 6253]|nr:hypothetical protein LTR53_014276 [Teratosphaeriaceae sp. CCFEE 6253]
MATIPPADSPIREVQLSALVVTRLIKHASTAYPQPATGCLVGMDVGAQLQVTNSFPFPASNADNTTGAASANNPSDPYHAADQTAIALAAPRAKSSVAYQNEMIKFLKEVNVDAQGVGWYVSCSLGNFVTAQFVENQAFYQRMEGERNVALVFDVGRSSQGSCNIKAYRLSPTFMEAHKEGKFTTERYVHTIFPLPHALVPVKLTGVRGHSIQKSHLRYQDILNELPVRIHTSHLLTTYLHQLPTLPPADATIPLPQSLAELHRTPLASQPLAPNPTTLDLAIDPYLESTCEALLQSLEQHQTELNNAQYHQRSLAREQAKITTWQAKRKQENALRAQQQQTPLDEAEWKSLFKLPAEPSRLEAMLIGRQVEQYGRGIDGFAAVVGAKMFGVRGNLLPGEAQ